MLKDLIEQGYGKEEDLNCAETILYGANKVYKLGLPEDCLRLAAAFGGGMGIENVCGVVTGSLMVISHLFVEKVAHQTPEVKEMCKELFNIFKEELGDFDCKPLKDHYRTEEKKCYDVILKGAEILDKFIAAENKKRGRLDIV